MNRIRGWSQSNHGLAGNVLLIRHKRPFTLSPKTKDFEELLVSLGHENDVMTGTRETVNKLWQMHCKLDDDVQCMKEGSGVDAIRELRAEMIGVTRKQRRALEEAVRSLNESKADRRELFLVQKKMASNAGACVDCLRLRFILQPSVHDPNSNLPPSSPVRNHCFSRFTFIR